MPTPTKGEELQMKREQLLVETIEMLVSALHPFTYDSTKDKAIQQAKKVLLYFKKDSNHASI